MAAFVDTNVLVLWACAEHYGLSPLYSEDFQHDRLYGTVRVINPFI